MPLSGFPKSGILRRDFDAENGGVFLYIMVLA